MRLYLAGVENRTKIFSEVRPPYVLFSFASVYASTGKREKVMQCVTSPWCKDFLCDSGAFTYRQKTRAGDIDGFDRYVDAYAEFIAAYNIKHFFEMDIDNIVGLAKVEEYRKRIERRVGRQCIPVWHSNRGWEYFRKMCAEYEYVSVGGIAKNPNGKKIEKIFPYLIEEAHKHGSAIHGLGYTDTKRFKTNHFDSVDSTTWVSGSRYGVVFECRGNAVVGGTTILASSQIKDCAEALSTCTT